MISEVRHHLDGTRFVFRGDWEAGVAYAVGDAVDYAKSRWECVKEIESDLPPTRDREHWKKRGLFLFLLGAALVWGAAQIAYLSNIGEANRIAAQTMWAESVDPKWSRLLNGQGWDARRQTFVVGGRALAASQMKRLSLAFSESVTLDLVTTADELIDGTITIETWQRRTAKTAKDSAIAMASFAAGGVARLEAEDIRDVEEELRYTLGRLRRFAMAAENGDVKAGTPDMIRHRARLYGARLNGLYELIRGNSHGRQRNDDGTAVFTEELNVLGNADHCDKNSVEGASRPEPGCIQETARGWVRFGKLSRPGERLCVMNCKCRLAYRGPQATT